MFQELHIILFLTLFMEATSLIENSAEEVNIIPRAEWGAVKQNGKVDPLRINPPTHVVIHHSASDTCTTRAICQAKIRAFQKFHINERKWSDIGYNFLIGEDGSIYEGRGWGKAGAHTVNYNEKSIGICFIGNYEKRIPNSFATRALKNLILYGIATGNINKKHTIIGHRQTASTSCPGDKLYEFIQTLSHWKSTL